MTERITDKAILMTAIAAVLITGGLTSTRLVVAVLLVFLYAFVSELFRKDIAILIMGVVQVAVALIFRESFLIYCFPIILYSFAVENRSFFGKKEAKDIFFLIADIIVAAVMVILTIENIPLILIEVLALPMGIRSAIRIMKQRELTERLDDARYSAIDTERKRREDRAKEDEKIYLATLEERNRIAREIHDNIGHMITRTLVQMEAIKIVNKDEALAPHLDSVSDTLNDAMTAVRKSVHELHNESIDLSIGINEAVKALPENFNCKVNTMIESAIPNETKNAVMAILKEAITNIVKYSDGDSVRVEFVENNTFWRLLVEDNGKNKEKTYDKFDTTSGIGIANMIDRCETLGGRANISSDRSGFRVRVTFPKKQMDI